MKNIFVPLIFFVSLLSACQTNENSLTFVGEGENWLAEVTVHQTKGEETYQIQLKNKGISIEENGAFHYHVASKNNGVVDFGVRDATLNQEGIYHTKLFSANSPSTSTEDELLIKVEWSDTSESFDLRSK